jgi:hypothetical protein
MLSSHVRANNYSIYLSLSGISLISIFSTLVYQLSTSSPCNILRNDVAYRATVAQYKVKYKVLLKQKLQLLAGLPDSETISNNLVGLGVLEMNKRD